MKVQLTISRAGARLSQSAGDIAEVGDEEGRRMIAAGQAIAINGKETATKKPATEKAVKE